jgi:hypothetical protein
MIFILLIFQNESRRLQERGDRCKIVQAVAVSPEGNIITFNGAVSFLEL